MSPALDEPFATKDEALAREAVKHASLAVLRLDSPTPDERRSQLL